MHLFLILFRGLRFLIFSLGAAILLMTSISCQEKMPEEDVIQLRYMQNQSVTYAEAIRKYRKLDSAFAAARLLEAGTTDVGKPLHLFVISSDEVFDPQAVQKSGKRVLLINNGVHPGEPCGMDASLQFANDLLLDKEGTRKVLDNTVICIVPVYSVGGMLKRTAYIRSNQVGPEKRGRRGNARNLDLNRDYMKQDTRNALSLARIFQRWQPDVFLDTHTTNGSDHQYTITLLPVQPSSLPPVMEQFMRNTMLPALYSRMDAGEYELIPYVTYNQDTPEEGIISYMQTSRVSTGYARLFNVFGFMTENHVYKPFADRVKSVYQFIRALTAFTSNQSEAIARARSEAQKRVKKRRTFTLDYKLDSTRKTSIAFKGYRKGQVKSALTGQQYRWYDHSRPFHDTIPFYNYYKPARQVEAPEYYIIPQAWRHVIKRLQVNGVQMHRLKADTMLTAGMYYITEHDHLSRSHNGHFYHDKIHVALRRDSMRFYAGDYAIPVNQVRNRYIVEALEPEAHDSFLRWNFFDSVLERRDWNNPSVRFEQNAMHYLEAHPKLKAAFEQKRKANPEFAGDHAAQLRFIFERSEWSRSIIGRYPVVRINRDISALLQ